MGYEAPETVYKLTFEDPALAGLEVRVRAATVGSIVRISHLPSDLRELAGAEDKLNLMLSIFTEHLAEWNLTRKGEPVPANREGVEEQEFPFLALIIGEWLRAVIGISGPLDETSPDGELEEVDLPMEPLPSTPALDSSSDSSDSSPDTP